MTASRAMTDETYFPFSAIVGQEDMKDALLCNAVNPDVGGVLIAGTRGTAKSTAVRSLAHLLPEIRTVADCPYHCPPNDPDSQCERCGEQEFADRPDLVDEIRTPFVNLPIGATDDRVLGTIDLEAAIQEGERSFEPGLLARANRGILYVDEVNLLGDHLVDVLLDAVATGTNRVEREGVSFEHPADVLLVGTMNPEEGELRPQLLDRFGLYVEMDRDLDPAARKAVVRRRTAFEDDPAGTMERWAQEEAALAKRIRRARARLPDTRVGDDALDRIVTICRDHDVDGLRADITMHRTARALAALDDTQQVEESHVARAAELVLGHRSNAGPSSDPGGSDSSDPPDTDGDSPDEGRDDRSQRGWSPVDPSSESDDDEGSDRDDGAADEDAGDSQDESAAPAEGAGEERVFPIAGGIEPPRTQTGTCMELPDATEADGRTRAVTNGPRGRYCRARRPKGRVTDVALDATVRAAAPHQRSRAAEEDRDVAIRLRPSDIREKARRSVVRTLVVFVVDSSGSMGAYERMSAVKGAILSLLEDAYQKRDAVSLVGFREEGAETLLAPTSSVRRAARELADMPTGGRTPLAAGLAQARRIVQHERRNDDTLAPLLVLVSDGRSNYAASSASSLDEAMEQASRIGNDSVPAVCFDTETGPVRLGIMRTIADRMGARYHRLDDLKPAEITETVEDVFYGGFKPMNREAKR